MNQESQLNPETKSKEAERFELMSLPPDLGGLATGADLNAVNEFRRKMQAFTKMVNTPPDKDKIKSRTEGGQTYKYLPVSTVEKDLNKMYFGLVQFEILDYKQIFNEMVVTARIKVFHPVIYQWLHFDGIGAGLIQHDSGKPIEEFYKYKKITALKLASPIAYAEAIKNASKKIGKRFGADLNRGENEDYYSGFNIPAEERDEKDKPLND